MTQVTNAFNTFLAVGNREDLTNTIYMISPTETPFQSAIAREPATNTLHEWQTDTLATVSTSNARIQGDIKAGAVISATTRASNRTQISDKTIAITGTQLAMNPAGRENEMTMQLMKAGLEIRRDMEAAMTQNQGVVAGTTGTAPKSRSYCAWITSNDSRGANGSDGSSTGASASSGTQRTFTEALLKTVLQLCYTAGGNPDTISANVVNRQKISGFGGNQTRYGQAESRELIATVGLYVSDFGSHKVVCNRFQRERDVLVYESDKWAAAFLRPFVETELAKTGDAETKNVLAEWTLVARNQASSGIVADCTTS